MMKDSQSQFYRILFGIFLAVVIVIIYAPSLQHAPRSDHWHYVADVARYNGDWTALALKTYNLNLSRVYAVTDNLLFRPLLYFILGNEQFFFGYNFMLWQLFSIFLFMALVWQIFRLLECIRPGALAALLSALFAVMLTNIELTTWVHINAYMVALIFIVTALRHLYLYVEKGEDDLKHLKTVFWMFLLAVFIFEVANYFCVLAWLYVWRYSQRPQDWKRLALVLAPCVIYCCISAPVLIAFSGGGAKIGTAFHAPPNAAAMIKYTTLALCWWLYSGALPWQNHITLGDRTIFEVRDPSVVNFLKDNSLGIGILLIVIVIGWHVYLHYGKKSEQQRSGGFVKLLAGMIFGFPIFLILGRNLPARLHLLGNHWYYHSVFWLFFIVMFHCLTHRFLAGSRIRNILAGGVLSVLIFVNACMVFTSNVIRADYQAPRRELLMRADAFVEQKKDEPGFSFYVPAGSKQNPVLFRIEQEDGLPSKPLSVLEAFYPQYFRQDHARYAVDSF